MTLARATGALPLEYKALVTATPQAISRALGSEASVILARDGVWDVLDAQQVCNIVYNCADPD